MAAAIETRIEEVVRERQRIRGRDAQEAQRLDEELERLWDERRRQRVIQQFGDPAAIVERALVERSLLDERTGR